MDRMPPRVMSQSVTALDSQYQEQPHPDAGLAYQSLDVNGMTYPPPVGRGMAVSRPFAGSGLPLSRGQGPPNPALPTQNSPNPTSSQTNSLSVSGLQNLVESLQISIAFGEVEQSKHLSALLAQYKTKIQMLLDKSDAEKSDLSLRVYVEYKERGAGCIVLKTRLKDTIADLKRKMLLQYRLPAKLQRWIVGKLLPADTDTLESLGITSNSSESPVYLYMMSAKFAGVDREQVEREYRRAAGMLELRDPDIADYEVIPRPSDDRVLDVPPVGHPAQASGQPVRPASVSGLVGYQATAASATLPQRRSTGQIREEGAVHPVDQGNAEENTLKWECPACTYRNYPTWPGCELCQTERPTTFQLPPNYTPVPRERERMAQETMSESQFLEVTDPGPREGGEMGSGNLSQVKMTPELMGLIQKFSANLAQHVERDIPSPDENNPSSDDNN